MPKVSVLIPAFRPDYLDICILSVICQTYSDIEIIIGDDSDGDDVFLVVSKWKDERIRYFRNPLARQPGANRDFLLGQATGAFIKFVFDDDFLMPNSVELLINSLEQTKAHLAFHGRYIVDSSGAVRSSPLYVNNGTIAQLTPDVFYEHVICRAFNIIGEPSNIMIRAQALQSIPHPFGINGQRMRFLTDVSLYFNFFSMGFSTIGIGVMGSAFRIHSGQTSNTHRPIYSAGLFEWEVLVRLASDMGRVSEEQFSASLGRLALLYQQNSDRFPELDDFLRYHRLGDHSPHFDAGFQEIVKDAYRAIDQRS